VALHLTPRSEERLISIETEYERDRKIYVEGVFLSFYSPTEVDSSKDDFVFKAIRVIVDVVDFCIFVSD